VSTSVLQGGAGGAHGLLGRSQIIETGGQGIFRSGEGGDLGPGCGIIWIAGQTVPDLMNKVEQSACSKIGQVHADAAQGGSQEGRSLQAFSG